MEDNSQTFTISGERALNNGGVSLLEGLGAELAISSRGDVGVFLRAVARAPSDRHQFCLGRIPLMKRFVACYRNKPFWMQPKPGIEEREVLPETQFFLAELKDGRYLFLVPLVDGWFRSCLQGSVDDHIDIICETGDTTTVGREVQAVYVGLGDCPFELIQQAMAEIAADSCSCRLRKNKPSPRMLDYFGWCTWNAFYGKVDEEGVRAGLQSLAEIGVPPKFVILDDGWQTTLDGRLQSFSANKKFPDGLSQTVQIAKDEFGVDLVYVWHTLQGYWRGVDSESMPEYHAAPATRMYGDGVTHHDPSSAGTVDFGLIPPEHAGQFINDFHRYLMRQGVDGVKVDNQAALEALGQDHGGRVSLTQAYREALEGSAHCHFLGEMINCMSCSNDMLFNALSSSVTRTSDDFSPDDNASHGLHIYTNALVSLFAGDLIHPDWDMFQSDHHAAAFHAAARALSGGPVYIADKPGSHNAALLEKLVLSDGTILRAEGPARPTQDSLFTDPLTEDTVFKVFNRNRYNGVIGAFSCQYHEDENNRHFIAGRISPSDIIGVEGDEFAIYLHNGRKLTKCPQHGFISIWLAELGYEVATVAPVIDGFAAIGLTDKLNSGAAVTSIHSVASHLTVSLRDGGEFIAYCENEPLQVSINGQVQIFDYDKSGKLAVNIPDPGPVEIVIDVLIP